MFLQDNGGEKSGADDPVKVLAETFAAQIPDLVLIPVEFQGFIICKSTPELAIDDVGKWVVDMVASK